MPKKSLALEIFLVSMAVILLEINYTRVFSFKLVYYFTYLIIGISLLGLGAGSVVTAMAPRLRRAASGQLIPACALAGGVSVLVGYWIVAAVQLNTFDLTSAFAQSDWGVVSFEGLKLVSVCFTLFVPFFFAGIVVSVILSTNADRVARLYFTDLMGAALGCVLVVPMMAMITPPGGVLFAGFLMVCAGLPLAREAGTKVLIPSSMLAAVLIVFACVPALRPEPVPDRTKTMSPQNEPDVLFSRWSPVFRVDVLQNYLHKPGNPLILSHDGMWGSVIPRYDGDPESLGRYDKPRTALPFDVIPKKPKVLIIGSAGGNEILASTHFEASHVTGVELNPVTVSLLREHFADYNSRIVEADHVTLVNAEGRAFLSQDEGRYDLIWFVAPDSYAAMNAATSGAFVLSESYLYTKEMIRESLEHLTPDGVVCAQFGDPQIATKPKRTARYLTTSREAFRDLGVENFRDHVLVASTPGFAFASATILLKRSGFSEQEASDFATSGERYQDTAVLFAGSTPVPTSPISNVITLPPDKLEAWYEMYPIDVTPISDDGPFFWHFVSFSDAITGNHGGGMEDGMGERLLVILLVVATLLAASLLLAPLLLRRDIWASIPHKRDAALYFAALGFGFMFLEVVMIQRLTLFLGYPTYSLTVTLFSILLATGAGSLLTERFTLPRNQLLFRIACVLVVLVLFYQMGMGPLVDATIVWPLPLRVAIAVALLTPLGLVLGMFMPIGLRTVASLSEYGEEYVAWAWAVNGFCSVVSSILSTMLSMTLGFTMVMSIAVAVYLVGIIAITRIPDPDEA
jgi:spermidine synthase